MRRTRTDVNHFLFLSAYFIGMIDALVIGFSTYGQLPRAGMIGWMLRGMSAVFILLKLFLDRWYTVKELLYTAVTGVILLLSVASSQYIHVLYLLLIALGIRNIDVKRVVRIDLYAHIALILFIVLSSMAGIIENYVTYRTDSPGSLRYSMGFTHPNVLAIHILAIFLKEAWLNKRKFTIQYALCIWLVAGLVYLVTTSRTSVLLFALYPLLLLVFVGRGEKKRFGRKMRLFLQMLFPAAFILCLITMEYCDRSQFFGALDQITSRRFTNCQRMFERYDIALFGQEVELVSVKQARLQQISIALLDIAYLRVLLQAGPIVLALLGWMHMCAVHEAVEENDRHALLILCIFIICGICESHYNNPYLNFSLLFGAKAVFAQLKGNFRHFALVINTMPRGIHDESQTEV